MNEATAAFFSSLTTAGLVIAALVIVFFAFAKFGVFNKLFDYLIQTKGFSTGFSKEALLKIESDMKQLLANDEDVKGRLCTLERATEKIDEKHTNLANVVNNNSALIRNMRAEADESRSQVYLGIIYASDIPPYERMVAAREYFKLGKDGNVRNFVIADLVVKDLQLWRSVRNDDKNPIAKDSPYYEHWKETIGYIERTVT